MGYRVQCTDASKMKRSRNSQGLRTRDGNWRRHTRAHEAWSTTRGHEKQEQGAGAATAQCCGRGGRSSFPSSFIPHIRMLHSGLLVVAVVFLPSCHLAILLRYHRVVAWSCDTLMSGCGCWCSDDAAMWWFDDLSSSGINLLLARIHQSPNVS